MVTNLSRSAIGAGASAVIYSNGGQQEKCGGTLRLGARATRPTLHPLTVRHSMNEPHLNKVSALSEVIARCKKCGREFVYVNPETELVDRYVPLGTPTRFLHETEPCGGEIEMISSNAT